MPGSSNIQQWNPTQTNQETDAQYSADTLRANGASNPSIFPSQTANKLFYQLSTFVAAFAQALANKGLSISDSDMSALASTLASVVTTTDLVPYAPLASPALTGTPTAPTPAAGNNTTDLATTAFVQNAITNGTGYNALFNELILNGILNVTGLANLGGGAIATGPPTNDNSTKVPNTNWVQTFTAANYETLTDMASAFQTSTGFYFFTKGGTLIQYGVVATGTSQPATVSFPRAFPTAVSVIVGVDQGDPTTGTSNVHTVTTQPIISNLSQFKVWGHDTSGNPQNTNVAYIAIGH